MTLNSYKNEEKLVDFYFTYNIKLLLSKGRKRERERNLFENSLDALIRFKIQYCIEFPTNVR